MQLGSKLELATVGESGAVQWLGSLTAAHAPVVLAAHACDAMSQFVLQDGQGRTGNAGLSQPAATTVDKRSGVINVGDTMQPEVKLQCCTQSSFHHIFPYLSIYFKLSNPCN